LVVHSLLLALLLAGHGRRRYPANGLLAAFVAVAGSLLFESWLGYSGAWTRAPHLAALFRPLWFTVGPLGYLYVRRSSGGRPVRWELLFAIPSLVVFFALLPGFLQSEGQGVARFLTSGATGTLVLFLGFSILTGSCAWAAACRLARVRALAPPKPGPEEGAEPPWRAIWQTLLMRLLAAYALVDFVATVSFVARGSYPAVVGLASLLVLVTLVYAIGYLVVLPDGLLARAARAAKLPVGAARSEISPGRAKVLAERLDRLMSEEELWRDEELRLDEVADRLGISRHHLSCLFNQHLETTFRAYLNTQRIAEVQRVLREGERSGSLLDTALACGFGSSASFYRAFRKHVGCTPKQFIANVSARRPAEGVAAGGVR